VWTVISSYRRVDIHLSEEEGTREGEEGYAWVRSGKGGGGGTILEPFYIYSKCTNCASMGRVLTWGRHVTIIKNSGLGRKVLHRKGNFTRGRLSAYSASGSKAWWPADGREAVHPTADELFGQGLCDLLEKGAEGGGRTETWVANTREAVSEGEIGGHIRGVKNGGRRRQEFVKGN